MLSYSIPLPSFTIDYKQTVVSPIGIADLKRNMDSQTLTVINVHTGKEPVFGYLPERRTLPPSQTEQGLVDLNPYKKQDRLPIRAFNECSLRSQEALLRCKVTASVNIGDHAQTQHSQGHRRVQ